MHRVDEAGEKGIDRPENNYENPEGTCRTPLGMSIAEEKDR